jgi:hypothetical protein
MRYQAALHSDVVVLSPLQLFFKPSSHAKLVLFNFYFTLYFWGWLAV